jgi:peptide deformylase
MAIRKIRREGDTILRKKSRKIDKIDERIKILAKDMLDTMYKSEGVGLAAPQVGILKRIIVVDVGEGPITIINPEIISQDGKQEEVEGCLSIPGKAGIVIRPDNIIVKGNDIEGKEIQIEGNGFLARALSHEIDHLEGVLFIDKVVKYVDM